MISLYRKKPVIIEAMGPLSPDNLVDIANWCDAIVHSDNWLGIPTLEGVMTASMGDYVIRGVAGEFYPCKPEIFGATYEAVK